MLGVPEMHPLVWGACIALGLLVTWLGCFPYRRWQHRKFPGPFGLPFLGNLPQIVAMDTTAFLLWAARKYGPICKVWFGTRPWIVISDVELVRKFSYKTAARPPDMGTFMHVMTGENRDIDQAGIVVVEGEAWRNTRRVFETSIILPSSLEAHLPAISRCLSRFLAVLERHEASAQPLEACQELGSLSLAMTGEIAYGVDFAADGGVGADLVAACRDSFDTLQIENATGYLALQLIFPVFEPAIRWLAHHLPDAKQRRAMRARTKVAEVSRLLMQQWQANKAAAVAAVAAAGEGGGSGAGAAASADAKSGGFAQVGGGIAASSFMAAMLEGRRGAKQGERLSDIEVIAQGFTFILAGFETTSSTLSFALFLLARDPEATRRLCAEVDSLPKLGAEGLTMEVLAQLPYAEAVMKEAMRLYPALSFYFRDTKEDVDLGGGKVVPKGSFVTCATHAIQRDPALWPEPERFLPDRFLPEACALRPTDPNAWTAFGMGPRMCVGYKLANLIAKATLVTLFQRYTFTLHHKQVLPLRTKTGLTHVAADGVWLNVHKRS